MLISKILCRIRLKARVARSSLMALCAFVAICSAPGAAEANPKFSPDRYKVAYALDGNIFVGDVFDSRDRDVQLTDNPKGVLSELPSWSPDGTKIAYRSGKSPDYVDLGYSDIWVVEVKSKKRIRLTNSCPGMFVDEPIWSSASDQITYLRRYRGRDERFITPANGPRSEKIVPNPEASSGSQTEDAQVLSPDGRMILHSWGESDRSDVSASSTIGGSAPMPLTEVPDDEFQRVLNRLLTFGKLAEIADNKEARLLARERLRSMRDTLGTLKCVNRACWAAAAQAVSGDQRAAMHAVLTAFLKSIPDESLQQLNLRDMAQVVSLLSWSEPWIKSLRVRRTEKELMGGYNQVGLRVNYVRETSLLLRLLTWWSA
jgi:hypothetical protein